MGCSGCNISYMVKVVTCVHLVFVSSEPDIHTKKRPVCHADATDLLSAVLPAKTRPVFIRWPVNESESSSVGLAGRFTLFLLWRSVQLKANVEQLHTGRLSVSEAVQRLQAHSPYLCSQSIAPAQPYVGINRNWKNRSSNASPPLVQRLCCFVSFVGTSGLCG